MAKKAQFDPNEALRTAQALVAQLQLAAGAAPAAEEAEAEAESKVDIPSAEDIGSMKKAEVRALCEQLSIDTKDKDIADLRAALVTLSNIAHDEDVEADEVKTLLGILDLEVSKKHAANVAAVKEYLQADTAAADDDEEESEEDDESEEKESDDDESEDDDESDDDESDDDESEDDESEDDDEKDGEDGEESEDDDESKDDDESEDDEDESEEDESEDDEEESEEEESAEVSDKEKKSRLAAYNEAAEKPLKSYEKLAALLVDDEGDTADWGTPYVKDESFHCCGLPLEDVKHKKKDAGKCQVTGAIFVQNDDGELKKVA